MNMLFIFVESVVDVVDPFVDVDYFVNVGDGFVCLQIYEVVDLCVDVDISRIGRGCCGFVRWY